jgi:UDP-N-acetyl-D-glucosamine dehydrogenase
LNTTQVAVIGQGYVGLPLAIAAAESGFRVFGIDTNESRIKKLSSGISDIEGIPTDKLQKQIGAGNYVPVTSYECIKHCDVVIICVPTPLTSDYLPDTSFVASVAKTISKLIPENSLVILESTVSPGFTRSVLVRALEEFKTLDTRVIHVAFSPERIDPLNGDWDIYNTPKILAGLTKEASRMAMNFYSQFIKDIVEVESIEVAETAKLLENSFRLVNISFINELAIFCNGFGIDVSEVIKAASTKPFGFMPFYPSLGAGGHCIPVDPAYLLSKSEEIGLPIRSVELALKINAAMPSYTISRAEKFLDTLVGRKILVIGVSYKSNVSDVRETPVSTLISGLESKGAKVYWHDDLVKEWNGSVSVKLSPNFDLAIIATLHDNVDLSKLENVPVINTKDSI